MKTFDDIVYEIFNVPQSEVRDDMSIKDIPEWDSMNYLLFIAKLEEVFSFSFDMDEIMNAKTLGELRVITEAHQK